MAKQCWSSKHWRYMSYQSSSKELYPSCLWTSGTASPPLGSCPKPSSSCKLYGRQDLPCWRRRAEDSPAWPATSFEEGRPHWHMHLARIDRGQTWGGESKGLARWRGWIDNENNAYVRRTVCIQVEYYTYWSVSMRICAVGDRKVTSMHTGIYTVSIKKV